MENQLENIVLKSAAKGSFLSTSIYFLGPLLNENIMAYTIEGNFQPYLNKLEDPLFIGISLAAGAYAFYRSYKNYQHKKNEPPKD